jgi:hexosaminidase
MKLLLPIKMFVAGLVMIIMVSCTPNEPAPPMDLGATSLIPHPVSVTATGSSFALTNQTGIYVNGENPEAARVAQMLADQLSPATGFSFSVQSATEAPGTGNIYLTLTENEELGDEGYTLEVTEDLVTVSANQPAGLFYGIQTIRQLLPANIEASEKQKGPWYMASGTITDYPEYEYRGSMLDVARHFFNVEETKRYIDLLAAYKINYLHLHLSDDQGWRIEIKSWPKLTEVGGSTEVGGGEGGFYTQEQYTELVNYAAERFITIVPEIDMPGHTNAALASYPELNCNPKMPNPELYTGTEVGFSTFCTDKKLVYEFINDVVGEIAAITPGPYFHIGGDESHVTPMKDYIPFIEQTQEIVINKGKTVMGWDEITHASLAQGTVAQFWDNAENAQNGVEQGAKILMSPAKRVYLDMQYDSTTQWGLHWAAYIEIEDSYNWEPTTYAEGISRENILGVEAPLWSETVTNIEEIEYMVFPRLPGIAEIAWSPASVRDWETYKVRLGKMKSRFEAMGINYYASEQVPWVE